MKSESASRAATGKPRRGLRPLSQTGFHRAPRNPRQRNFEEGGTKKKGTILASFNEAQEDRQLHPTKGFRKLSVKRARAQMLMAEIQQGHGRSLERQRRFLVLGY